MKLTRRQLAAALTSTVALAQTPQPPPATVNPQAELSSARDAVRANAVTLLQIEIPMATEPAFEFHP